MKHKTEHMALMVTAIAAADTRTGTGILRIRLNLNQYEVERALGFAEGQGWIRLLPGPNGVIATAAGRRMLKRLPEVDPYHGGGEGPIVPPTPLKTLKTAN